MEERKSAVDWAEVDGEKFDLSERRDAQDFSDMVDSYSVEIEEMDEETLRTFFESGMRVGVRLFLIKNIPQELVGAFIMRETDERLLRVAAKRTDSASKGKLVFK